MLVYTIQIPIMANTLDKKQVTFIHILYPISVKVKILTKIMKLIFY